MSKKKKKNSGPAHENAASEHPKAGHVDGRETKTDAAPDEHAKGKMKTSTLATGGATAIERAFVAGNYADVRALARSDDSERSRRLLALTQIDVGQLAVGLVAVAVVLLAVVLTLR